MTLTDTVKQFTPNDSIGVDQERSRMRNSVQSRSLLHLLIPNLERANRLALRIGQQRILDHLLLGESLQGIGSIIADSDQINSRLVDSIQVLLQLNQLPNTKRSPVRRTMEDDRQHAILLQ